MQISSSWKRRKVGTDDNKWMLSFKERLSSIRKREETGSDTYQLKVSWERVGGPPKHPRHDFKTPYSELKKGEVWEGEDTKPPSRERSRGKIERDSAANDTPKCTLISTFRKIVRNEGE